MSQKILASHCNSGVGISDLIEVRVDQVILARAPNRVLGAAVDAGLELCAPEVCVAYPPHCVSIGPQDQDPRAPERVPQAALSLGFLVAQPGAGFASQVHLERFGGPARIALSDEPKLASCGAAGMLCMPASRSQLVEALLTGKTWVRPAVSVLINLSGRLRPFVGARDLALELVRRGVVDVIREIDKQHRAPVVLEFGGSSTKFLSVSERGVLATMAPQLGAATALFASDDKTEIFLRDQRRSKAHRALAPDSGAPFQEVLSIDLATIDPLLMDHDGRIRQVRDLEGQSVQQVLLGGDSGISLRDFLAAAVLLKSKRVSPGLEFLLCPPSRQTLEVLGRSDALNDLLVAGARLVEPDRRVLNGQLYGGSGGLMLRNADRDENSRGYVASTETLCFAVAHGKIGDPRNFKRPVRISIPRSLPTDDVLLSRGVEARGSARGKGRVDKRAKAGTVPPPTSDRFSESEIPKVWSGPLLLNLGRADPTNPSEMPEAPSAFVAQSLEEVAFLVGWAPDCPQLRAVVAPHIPAASVSVLSGLGVLALCAEPACLSKLAKAQRMRLPAPRDCTGDSIDLHADEQSLTVQWLARGAERTWTSQD